MSSLPRYVPVLRTEDRSGNERGRTQSVSSAVYNSIDADWWTEAEASLFTKWASSYETYFGNLSNPYFDYFFTGQDIQVSIDGLTAIDDILPIYSFGYAIQQQKQPLYGFWSYEFDAVLRGTRLVSGAFSIVSSYPNLLTSKIAKAATVRAQSAAAQRVSSMNAVRGLNVDERLIDRFWSRHYTDLEPGQQHLFNIHPPFNFVVKYGVQETSYTDIGSTARVNHVRNKFQNNPIYTDVNERLVENPHVDLDMQILLENIELMSKQIQFDVDGDPLLETYTFIARDERLLKPVDPANLTPAVPDSIFAAELASQVTEEEEDIIQFPHVGGSVIT